MIANPRVRRLCLSGMGMIILVVLIAGSVNAVLDDWVEETYDDFNGSDTKSNIDIRGSGSDKGRVHLADSTSQTHSNDYNDSNNYTILFHDTGTNPPSIGSYSQSFYPTINGVVDKVEMQIYTIGEPTDDTGQGVNDATVTIKIISAYQNTQLPNELGTVFSTRTMYYDYFPTQSGVWTTVWLSYSDSIGTSGNPQTAVGANIYYTLVVGSDADWDSTHQNEIRLEFKNVTNANTVCGEKIYWWNQQVPEWQTKWQVNSTFDFPFRVYVHNFVSSGYLISKVHDTTGQPGPSTYLHSVQWGEIKPNIQGVITTVSIFTRGGDTSVPDETWSSWVDQTNFRGSYDEDNTPAPHGRYLQYKIELTTNNNSYTACVDLIAIEYETI